MFQNPFSNINTVITSKDMNGTNDNTPKSPADIQRDKEKEMQSKKHKELMCN